MQKIQSYLCTLLCVLLFISCSDKSSATAEAPPVISITDSTTAIQEQNPVNPIQASSNVDDKLLGSWLVTDVVGEHQDLNMGLVYTWTKDGKMLMEREFTIQGTYTVKNNVIVWTTKDFEFTYDYTISGDVMTLVPRNSGHTYTLKKR